MPIVIISHIQLIMIKWTTALLLFLLLQSGVQTAKDITQTVTKFSADCQDLVAPEEEVPFQEPKPIKGVGDDFKLFKFRPSKRNSRLIFQVKSNCAQENKGTQIIRNDTLVIQDTNLSILQMPVKKIDSLEYTIEIQEEIRMAGFTSCDCLISYSYTFAYDLSAVKYLKFHENTFKLKD